MTTRVGGDKLLSPTQTPNMMWQTNSPSPYASFHPFLSGSSSPSSIHLFVLFLLLVTFLLSLFQPILSPPLCLTEQFSRLNDKVTSWRLHFFSGGEYSWQSECMLFIQLSKDRTVHQALFSSTWLIKQLHFEIKTQKVKRDEKGNSISSVTHNSDSHCEKKNMSNVLICRQWTS